MSESTALVAFNLTDRQEIFVKRIARGALPTDAASYAGFSGAEQTAWRLLQHPVVAAALEAEIWRVLKTESAPLALQVLQDLVRDEKTGPRIRVDAAKILLDRGGYTPAVRVAGDKDSKTLAEMTGDELRAFIEKQEAEIDTAAAELAARAVPVNESTDPSPSDEAYSFLD